MFRRRVVYPGAAVVVAALALAARRPPVLGRVEHPELSGWGGHDDSLWDQHNLPLWAGQVAVVAALAVALWLLVRHGRRVVRTLRHWEKPPQGDVVELRPWAEDLTERIRRDASASLAHLAEADDVGDAVVACWRRFEGAAAAEGVERRAAETSDEFTVRAIARTTAAHDPLRTLAHLYRRTLFDPRPLGEGERQQAVGALEALLASMSPGGTR